MTPDLEALRTAFQHRHSDAYMRADRLLLHYAQKASAHLKRARTLLKANEAVKAHQASLLAKDWLDRIDEIEKLVKDLGGWVPVEKVSPTPELLNQVANGRGDPVTRLFAKGDLDEADLRDAIEIGNVARFSAIRLEARTSFFPIPVQSDEEPAGNPAEAAEWYVLLRAKVYEPWSLELGSDLDLVLGLVVEGQAVETLRKRHHLRWDTVVERIRGALKAYRKVRGRAIPKPGPGSSPAAPGSSSRTAGTPSHSPNV